MLPLQHDPSVGELQDFFHAHSTPLVGHYTYATKEKRYKDRRPLVLAFYTVDFGHDHKDGTFSVASKGTCGSFTGFMRSELFISKLINK